MEKFKPPFASQLSSVIVTPDRERCYDEKHLKGRGRLIYSAFSLGCILFGQ
jgi:hypothetical protein